MNGCKRLVAIVTVLAVAACGGGMQAGVGSGGSGAPMSVGIGPVTGFGSILMNGERYDETRAAVQIDERPDQPTPATVAAIRLGMHVELQHADFVVSTATASAELIGPVTSVAASGFVALAQTVRINADPARPTVFDGFETLADLANGAVVEVHGDRASSGEILATRVERRPAGLALVRIAGAASSVGSRGFAFGGLAVDTTAATVVPAGAAITNGQRVVAWTDVPYAGGPLVAKVLRVGSAPLALVDGAAVTVDGVAADVQSATSFRIGGVAVSVGHATFTGGTASNLVNGAPVRVRGTMSGSVLQAASVEFLQAAQATVELTGPVTDFVDASSAFRVRDTVVSVSTQTTFTNGAASNLGNGVLVQVTGRIADDVVEAATVAFLAVVADTQRVVVGQVVTPPGDAAADGSRTFRIDALDVDVKLTNATSYENGMRSDLAAGRRIKLTGTLTGAQFVADDVQFLDNPANPPLVEIEGIAANVGATSVTVNGQDVRLTDSTIYTLDGTATGAASLKNGLDVDIVASRFNDVLTAASIDIRSPAAVATTVRGIVSGRAGPDSVQFLVGTQRVSVAGSPKIVPGNKTLADVVNGADVEVEGTLANGVLAATRIKFR